MEQVLGESSKVMLDVKQGGNSLLYLPIDQMMRQRPGANSPKASQPTIAPTEPDGRQGSVRQVDRERRTR